jgi:hypothetical protein
LEDEGDTRVRNQNAQSLKALALLDRSSSKKVLSTPALKKKVGKKSGEKTIDHSATYCNIRHILLPDAGTMFSSLGYYVYQIIGKYKLTF